MTVDGQESYVTASYKNGLKAKQIVILTTQSAWKATAGGHAVKAEADYRNKLTDELTRDNNILGKKFNVAEKDDNGDYTPVTGGYDLVVTKVAFDKKTINPGDEVRFTATIVNASEDYTFSNWWYERKEYLDSYKRCSHTHSMGK